MNPIYKCHFQAMLLLAIIAFSAFLPSADAAEKSSKVRYPDVLHGYWLPTESIDARINPCELVDHGESDSLIEITASEIMGYENRTRPTRVIPLTKQPRSWQILSNTDSGDGFFSDVPAIFTISGNLLTVVSDTHSIRFVKCIR